MAALAVRFVLLARIVGCNTRLQELGPEVHRVTERACLLLVCQNFMGIAWGLRFWTKIRNLQLFSSGFLSQYWSWELVFLDPQYRPPEQCCVKVSRPGRASSSRELEM